MPFGQTSIEDMNFKDAVDTVFGEEAQGNRDHVIAMGSTILNRFDSDRKEEFGTTIPEITGKGYYAKINKNNPYRWADSGQFPDTKSEELYKETAQTLGALSRGEIERMKGVFAFTEDEIKKKKKQGGFDFDAVEEVGRAGKYILLDYKKSSGSGGDRELNKSIQRSLKEKGYDVGKIDGIRGKKWDAAVKQFQKDHGLVVDGIVGKKTMGALGF